MWPRDARRRILKRWYFDALRVLSVDDRAMVRHAARGHLLVLNVHSVSPDCNAYAGSLHPELFAELLAWLDAHARVVLFDDLRDDTLEHDARRPLVVLSFDDGLRDFVEHAMPILAGFGMLANQNVIGAAVETGEPPWAIGLLDLLGAASPQVTRALRVPGMTAAPASDDPLAKERFAAVLTNHLKSVPPPERAPILLGLHEALQHVVVERPTMMMSADDVRAARVAGHEIGAHSYSHESMEHLDDEAFLADFRRCRAVLARAGCEDCAVYAFPNGSHRPGQAELLRRHGVRQVLLVGERPSMPHRTVHPRLTLRGGSLSELRARAAHALGAAG